MRTQKRAKSISFGKKKTEEEKVVAHPSKEEAKEAAVSAPKVKEEPKKEHAPELENKHETKAAEVHKVEQQKAPSEDASEHEEKDDLLEQSKKLVEERVTEEKKEEPAPVVSEQKEEIQSEEKIEPKTEASPPPSKPEASITLDEPNEESSKESPPTSNATGSGQAVAGGSAGDAKEEEKSENSAFYIQDSRLQMPERTHKKKNRFLFQFFVIALISFIVGLGVAAAVDYLMNKKEGAQFDFKALFTKVVPQPTPTPTPTPKVEPTPESVDFSKQTIRVLNGSGVSGRAAKLKEQLEEAGFTVSTTGNADNSDYEKTKITAKKSVSGDFLKKLEETLKKSYVLDETSRLADSASPDVDVTVTIGKEIK